MEFEKVIAFDEKGNTWKYDFNVFKRGNKDIISLGFPFEWFADDIIKHPPEDNKICIDVFGRNYSGYAVFVSFDVIKDYYISFKIDESEKNQEPLSYEEQLIDNLDSQSIF